MSELSGQNPFWTWSMRAYDVSSVKDRLLELQNEDGADINLLLLLAWHADQSRGLSDDGLEKAKKISRLFLGGATGKVRTWRSEPKALKDPELKKRLLEVELACEYAQQEWLSEIPAVKTDVGFPGQVARLYPRLDGDERIQVLGGLILTQKVVGYERPDSEQIQIRAKLKTLKAEHRAMDMEVKALIENGAMDQLKIARLKKEKLALKDRISRLEDQLTPDIIA